MAGTVQQARQQDEFGPPNKVLKVAPVTTNIVIFTDNEGRKSMCLTYQFGKDVEDGGPGVYVLANQQQMSDQLKIASKLVRDGVRRSLAEGDGVRGENIPVSVLGPADLTTGQGFDVSQVEVDDR